MTMSRLGGASSLAMLISFNGLSAMMILAIGLPPVDIEPTLARVGGPAQGARRRDAADPGVFARGGNRGDQGNRVTVYVTISLTRKSSSHAAAFRRRRMECLPGALRSRL